MKQLLIEWKHYDKEGNTCVRCSNTGIALQRAISDLREDLKEKGIRIVFKETKLSEDEIQASNSIILNNVLLEDLLDDARKVETTCNSCCELIGSDVSCRALDCRGQTIEDINVTLIKEAINNLLRKEGL